MTREEPMTAEESMSWKEKALEAIGVLQKISQPPLLLATLTDLQEETVQISTTDGHTHVVSYDPRIKDELEVGNVVRISPETFSVVGKADDKLRSRYATEVSDVLKDGRIKIRDQSRDKVIPGIEGVRAGDTILTDASLSVILENLGNQSKAYHLGKVPEVPWNRIGGLERTIEQIKQAVEYPHTFADLYKSYPNKSPPKGVLLYGAPGCGKTLLGKAIAYNLAKRQTERDGQPREGYFLYAAGPEFLNKWVGEGESRVRQLFNNARETAAQNGDPVVVFIDEPESVLKRRGTGISTDVTDSLVNQFLVELDGMDALENIVVLLATNRHDILDPAVVRPGRIDRKIYVPRPDQAGTADIFGIYLQGLPLEQGRFQSQEKTVRQYAQIAAEAVFDPAKTVAQITYRDGTKDFLTYRSMFSGASAVSIVDRATDLALMRGIEGKNPDLCKEDLFIAVDQEYQENRLLLNQITSYDIQEIAGDRHEHIAEITPTRFTA